MKVNSKKMNRMRRKEIIKKNNKNVYFKVWDQKVECVVSRAMGSKRLINISQSHKGIKMTVFFDNIVNIFKIHWSRKCKISVTLG